MNKQEIHEAIKDYRWIMNMLIRKRSELTKDSKGLVGKYGIEATLPKPNNISDPVYQEMLRIEKYNKNTKKLRNKVMFIQEHSKCVTDVKNKMILDLMLDGKTLREIAVELDMSHSGVKGRKDYIVHQMYMSAQNVQKDHISN